MLLSERVLVSGGVVSSVVAAVVVVVVVVVYLLLHPLMRVPIHRALLVSRGATLMMRRGLLEEEGRWRRWKVLCRPVLSA